MQFFVYILRCSNGAYYVGSHRGRDVTARVHQHNHDEDRTAYTYRYRPVELLWSCAFADPSDMVAFERQLKGWSRRKKEAFMRGDWADLKALSKSRMAPAIHEKGRYYLQTQGDTPKRSSLSV
ncbi:GIY-YIG nuclease family protein [Henriciella aquimarina]|uniref:GIY-YIG nuclease family protein n=1 Tax=Henriciella aquimarina TaxID=545261 RepID=UPI0009FE2F0A|nr:GIY-YIG nuclease family protein [Henriciella aquimarina]